MDVFNRIGGCRCDVDIDVGHPIVSKMVMMLMDYDLVVPNMLLVVKKCLVTKESD